MKYFKQENYYTCGCASVRMVLSNFQNNIPSEKDLLKLLNTNSNRGTDKIDIINYFHNLNFDVVYKNNSNIDEVKKYFNNQYIIILLVSVDVPHFVVLKDINNHQMKIYDPFFGKRTLYNRKFNSNLQKYPLLRWRILEKEFSHLDYDFTGYNEKRSFIAVKDCL